MLTRFISDSAWGSPEYIYPYDSTVDLKNNKLFVAGNMNVNATPFLDNLLDFSNNNYSTFYLTDKKDYNTILNTNIDKDIGLSSDYPVALAVYGEGLLVREDTRFLECQSLYRQINQFNIDYITINSGVSGLSGGSFVFSSAFPAICAFELGFSIENREPVFKTDLTTKVSVPAEIDLYTSLSNLTAAISGYSFCDLVSASYVDTSHIQTYRYTLSSKQPTFDARDLYGYSFIIGNTKLGIKDPNDFIYGFGYHVRISDVPLQIGAAIPPQITNRNQFYRIPTSISNAFNSSTTMETIVRAVTAIFEESAPNISEPYPISRYYALSSVQYDSRGLTIVFYNKIPGATVLMPYTVDIFSNNQFINKIEVLSAGYYSGFNLTYKERPNKTTQTLTLPSPIYSNNTLGSLTGSSDLFLNLKKFEIERSFRPNMLKLIGTNNSIFLNFNKINDKQVLISHNVKDRRAILIADDLLKTVIFLDSQFVNESNINLAKFNFLIDDKTKRVVLYKIIEGKIFALSKLGDDLALFEVESIENISTDSIFYIFNFVDAELDINRNLWTGYERDVNTNNLNIDPTRSLQIQNNFLFHSEYAKSLSAIYVNFLPLKNQLNEVNNQNRKLSGVHYREYHTVFTGDNTETGNSNISLGYTTTTKEFIFKSGEVTWFHLPYNETFKRININDSNFFVNGAVPGLSPVFSDKIWKKIGDYKYTSNLGNSNKEQTGQWLCSWLSGSKDSTAAVWMDRFYNPDIITEVEAIKFTNNIEYIPSYTSKNYPAGISDRKSSLTLEPGVWYAYNHVGKKDAVKIVDFLKRDLAQSGLLNINPNALGEYVFAGSDSGYISIEKYKTPINNFSLSFFGYSDNWSRPFGNQLLGNYLDTGFGVFNYKEVNPLNFYFNKDTITIYNDENKAVLNIKQPPALSGNIVAVFRREYFENFHVVLDNLNVLEYNLEGTLVDVISGTNIFPRPQEKNIISYHNNLDTGVILYEDGGYVVFDLKTNNFNVYTLDTDRSTGINTDVIGGKTSVYIDPFGKIYKVKGKSPLLREDKCYYIDNFDNKKLMVCNTVTNRINVYIDTKTLETSAAQQRVTAFYKNTNQSITENPYSSFDLSNLSGAGLTLYSSTPGMPENDVYHVGFSIYKEPYIFYNTDIDALSSAARNPVYVDLHGNYWYNHTTLSVPDILNNNNFGKRSYVNTNNNFFISDPYFEELLGATTATYGKVYLYTLENNELRYVTAFEKGPRPQIYTIKYDASFGNTVSSFPLSSYLILTNGTEINSNPTFGGVQARYTALSSISLAFTYQGSQPYYYTPEEDVEPGTKVTVTFTGVLTSTYTLAQQLTGSFGKAIVPVVGTATLYPLSSFYQLDLVSLNETSFEYKITNKYPGSTNLYSTIPNLVASGTEGVPAFKTGNTDINGGPYILDVLFEGKNGLGQDGEEFGYEIKSIPQPESRDDAVLAISSPRWKNNLTNGVGKVELFFNVNYPFELINTPLDNNDRITNVTYTTGVVYPNFTADGLRFGHSVALSGFGDIEETTLRVGRELLPNIPHDAINKKLLIGAPSFNYTNYPYGSAFFYRVKFPELTVESVSALSVTGPASAGFGMKVDLGHGYYGASVPFENEYRGGVYVYGYQYNDPFSTSQPDEFVQVGARQFYQIQNRYKFGASFKLNGRYLAVAGLSASTSPIVMTVDIFKRNNNDTSFTYLRTLSTPFISDFITSTLSNETTAINFSLSSVNLSFNMDNNNIVIGAWRGNESDLGDERGKVAIWYYKNDNFYLMYENQYTNLIPIPENDLPLTYFGNNASLAPDKIFSGTTFINNSGNSLTWVASSIKVAIDTQTNKVSGYTASIDFISDNDFGVTVTSILSAKARKSAEVRNVLTTNPALCSANEFYRARNFDGSTLHYSGDILSYTFDKNEETVILTDYSKLKVYDVLGDPKEVIDLQSKGLLPTLSATKFAIQTTVKNREVKQDYAFLALNPQKEIYKINYNPDTNLFLSKKIDSNINSFFTSTNFAEELLTYSRVTRNDFDINNNYLMLGDIRLKYPEPSLSFKIRLNNRLNFEESEILAPIFFTSDLSRGWHHFVIVFDSVNGVYKGYVDLNLVFSKTFKPNKYSFSNVLKNNLIVGSSPYYNNITFNDFYNSQYSTFYVDGLTLDKINFYNKVLNESEIKFLTYEKTEPDDLKVQIDFGSRNYIDTVSRVFKQRVPGKKSTSINIVINDSLITDRELQQFYETKILAELKDYLPGYVRINKIEWVSNKPSREKITQGDINVGNTLTNSGGVE